MLERLEAALLATGYLFARYGWSSEPDGDYGVIVPDGQETLALDNCAHAETALTARVDYFTRDSSDAPRETVEAALDESECAWQLVLWQHEEDTGYIHYEWLLEAV